jgi:hypothetical protein
MPPPERTFDPLMSFLKAPTWGRSRQIVNAHHGLINVWVEIIDTMLKDPATLMMLYPGKTRSDATAMLKKRRAVLVRCRQVGIAQAFAEVGGQGTQSQGPDRRGGAWVWAVFAIAVIAVIAFVVIRLHSGSNTPGNVTASAIDSYTIQVSWTDDSKNVTAFNLDNGCPAGACGGHGVTLAKTTRRVGSTTFRVTPGTYQCFRVQAILNSGVSAWSGYGCASTPGLVISGTQAWTPTGVILHSGDRLYFAAAGLMSIGSSSQVDPSGDPSCTPAANDAATASSFPAPHLRCLSLIARVGGGPPFEVGTSAVVITGRGRLYLGVNANDFSGSSGNWSVNMKIGGAPPSP